MKIQVLFFAQLQELYGKREDWIETKESLNPKQVLTRLFEGKTLQGEEHFNFAVNEAMVSGEEPLHHGDVLAFIPPVAGG